MSRIISEKGRFLQKVQYSDKRPSTPFNNPNPADLGNVFWTKGKDWDHQEEWRIISPTPTTEILRIGEIAQVIFGYRFAGDKAALASQPIFEGTHFFETFPHPSEFRMSVREFLDKNGQRIWPQMASIEHR